MEQFRQRVGELIDTLRGLPRHPDFDRVLLPGERSHATAARQRREGIALSTEVSDALRKLADAYGYARPPWMEGRGG
jgi:LDH2 family malate/lactate/ureidoglycolate dehydrogenase